jgi:hypothetical protein
VGTVTSGETLGIASQHNEFCSDIDFVRKENKMYTNTNTSLTFCCKGQDKVVPVFN